MHAPLVSVLMTAYNREKYIAEAIGSVLASSYENFELIIVDDCSADKTVSIAREYEQRDKRIKLYVNEKNLGDYNNRNKAASYASGKYLKFLDSDDLIYKYGLAIMVESMERYPEAGAGISATYAQDDIPYPFLLQPADTYKKHFFEYYILESGPSSLIFKTETFRQLGGFSGKNYVGDTELMLKLAAHFPCLLLNSSLIYWRKHEGQEIVKERKDFAIPLLRYDLLHQSLVSDQCPLSAGQSKILVHYYEQHVFRSLLKQAIVSRNSVYKSQLRGFVRKYRCGFSKMIAYTFNKPRRPVIDG